MSNELTGDDIIIFVLSRALTSIARRDLGEDATPAEIAGLIDKLLVKACQDAEFSTATQLMVKIVFQRRIHQALDRLGSP
jgi:hypothetical protein